MLFSLRNRKRTWFIVCSDRSSSQSATQKSSAFNGLPGPDLAHLHDQSVADGDAAVHAGRDVHVVGGDHHGQAGGSHELRQGVEHVLGGARVEVSGRLVGEQDARRIGDRARDRDPLLLAARELCRPMVEPLLQPEIAEAGRSRAVRLARDSPRIICGSITFSIAENSGSR